MIAKLKAYAAALDDWPSDAQGIRRHFSMVLPEMLKELEATITEELSYNEMWALMEVLDLLMYGPANKGDKT